MKILNRKEVIWLLVTIIFILLIYFLIFGKEGFKSESTFDLNTHDTYLVISNIHFIFTLSILLFFGVYLVRSLNTKFKNLIVNIILMISTILLIIILKNIFPFIEIINEKNEFPSLSRLQDVSEKIRSIWSSFDQSQRILRWKGRKVEMECQ